MLPRIWWVWRATSPSISLPVAGSWATCPLRNSSPTPRTPSENGPTGAASLSVAIASRVMVNESFHLRRWLHRAVGWFPVNVRDCRFRLLRHDPAGGSSGRSVVHTPRDRETGRPRAAQFAPWAVYIPGGGTTWCGRKERRMVTADLLARA